MTLETKEGQKKSKYQKSNIKNKEVIAAQRQFHNFDFYILIF
jgi:hypothetical protein